MTRVEKFINWLENNDLDYYNGINVIPICDNLEIADRENKLTDFLLNIAPYRSYFTFKQKGVIPSRKSDYGAIVVAINIYGIDHPGFAQRIRTAFAAVYNCKWKKRKILSFALNLQANLQKIDISQINFVDEELHILYINNMKKEKAKHGILYLALVVALTVLYGTSILSGLIFLAPISSIAMIISMIAFIGALAVPNKKLSPEAYKPVADYIEITNQPNDQATSSTDTQ